MKIILTAIDEPLAKAWTKNCGDLDFVQIQRCPIFDVACDAVVSPSNSFGFMDGGIDLLYMKYFGGRIQQRLQDPIVQHHHGELLVGTAEIVETDDKGIPFLVAAPTMRVPTILRDTVNSYLAGQRHISCITLAILTPAPVRGSAPALLLVDNGGATDFPSLKPLMNGVDRDSWEARFASLSRSRRHPLDPAFAEELIRVYEPKHRSATADQIAATYDEAMPCQSPKLDTHRRATCRRLLAKAGGGRSRCCCSGRLPARR